MVFIHCLHDVNGFKNWVRDHIETTKEGRVFEGSFCTVCVVSVMCVCDIDTIDN